MPRPARVHVEVEVYHVYSRLARGGYVCDREREAAAIDGLFGEVVRRDGSMVFAWCLMSHTIGASSGVPQSWFNNSAAPDLAPRCLNLRALRTYLPEGHMRVARLIPMLRLLTAGEEERRCPLSAM